MLMPRGFQPHARPKKQRKESLDKRHVISLQGQDFITYEGLLNEAHAKGLKSIRTRLVQLPDTTNGHTAVVTAEVELEGGKVFAGIGDANPQNVNSMIAKHLIRMAETRAKARAFRDAVNIGMTSLVELDDTGALSAEAPSAGPRGVQADGDSERMPLTAAPIRLATPKQINKVAAEMARVGWSEKDGRDYLLKTFNKLSRSELTSLEISRFIDHLAVMPGKESA
ncbi:hypothetical protein D3C72_131920 [compost metagenome]